MSSVTPFDTLVINTIRTLSMDAVQKANSGHPGAPMGLAPVAYVLWDRFLRYNPSNPDWPNRDRFVLSAGHASMLLYSILHISGYDVSLDDIQNFRQLDRKCAGHPEFGLTPGVETTTGPLGQGAANSVGMAIAEKWLEEYYNRDSHRIIDYNIFAVLGDGCMMEGITGEAASLAGHLGLDNLIWIYDSNRVTIEGATDLAFSEDVAARFKAYNWHVQNVADVNDLGSLSRAIDTAVGKKQRPSLIVVRSHIAYGSPNKQDDASTHGAPLGEDEVAATKQAYGWDPAERFHIPPEIGPYRDKLIARGAENEEHWSQKFAEYKRAFPDLADAFEKMQTRQLPDNWASSLPEFPANPKGPATRQSNGKILNAVAPQVPWLIGGSADLAPSNMTYIDGAEDLQAGQFSGRNIHFGIREHAMGAIVNGMCLSRLRPYAATFLVFSDYMRPAIRLAAMMEQPVIYIFTHDSIGVGEDGPTHQPIEQLAALRAIPNLDVIRPADSNELAALWKHIMPLKDRPVALVLSRQSLPTIDRSRYFSADGALRGGYILADAEETPEVILIGTGSEIQHCLAAFELLAKDGIRARVVSMPCWSLFERQDHGYCEEVLPKSVRARVAVEAGSSFGWSRFVGGGETGIIIGLDRFGASAPAGQLMKEFRFTAESVVQAARAVIARQKEQLLNSTGD
ncbi:MAG: transketolase [candidate division Zixibacteria bacterium]|nr:transketolase [candidate division Zixibacteria bacterium]